MPLQTPVIALLRTAKATPHIQQIHAQLITTNLISDPFNASRLVESLTLNVPKMTYAELVFDQIPEPTVFLWNLMVRGYASNSEPERVLRFFIKMRRNDLVGDNYTYPLVLKACSFMGGIWEGREVRGEIVKVGFEWDVFVRNGLIGIYCKFKELGCARPLFDGFSGKDVVAWNLLLGLYVCSGEMDEAQKLLDEMPERDVASYSIMIDGSGKKFGDVIRAHSLFDIMPNRDIVSWNSMIHSYAQKNGNPKEALTLFRQMIRHGVKPDKLSVVGALSACGQLGALDQGRWIHIYMQKNEITLDIVVQTALVDMYMKCGSTNEALVTFNNMSERNIVTWNTEGFKMDDLIFVSVLTACTHAGLVASGLEIFSRMRGHGIEPKLEHYGCLIDLLGRAGQLEQAIKVMESMSMEPNSALWGSLLLACRTYKNVALAEVALQKLVELHADDCDVYVLMSNIYANAGMWEHAARMRKLMKNQNMKDTGRSIIEVDGNVLEFVNSEKAHFRYEGVEMVIWSLFNMMTSRGVG
ncbi:hypothetical protein NMG60_11035487 [Bertholletia excelsa]